jgi:hypothetical protein
MISGGCIFPSLFNSHIAEEAHWLIARALVLRVFLQALHFVLPRSELDTTPYLNTKGNVQHKTEYALNFALYTELLHLFLNINFWNPP